MDIWSWVNQSYEDAVERGDLVLAGLINDFPDISLQGDTGRLEALLYEALELSKDYPWLQVFFRHWYLQHRVFIRGEGEAVLRDAVALVERSHRDDAKGCPQSVCTVQDLASCYGRTDGPGYAAERLAVSDETLQRIDPTWSCWRCIVEEKSSALLDSGRPEEALEVMTNAALAKEKVGESLSLMEISDENTVRAMLSLGRATDAYELLMDAPEPDGEVNEVIRQCLEAQCLLALNRFDEVQEALPLVEAISPYPGAYLLAAQTLAVCAKTIGGNSSSLGVALAKWSATLMQNGAWWHAIQIATLQIELSVLRNAATVATWSLKRVRTCASHLRHPEHFEDTVAKLEALVLPLVESQERVITKTDVPLDSAPEILEQEIDRLDLSDSNNQQVRTHIASSLGFRPEARLELENSLSISESTGNDHLWAFHFAHADRDTNAMLKISDLALSRGHTIEFHWMRARLAELQHDDVAVEQHCAAILREKPEANNTRKVLVNALLRGKAWEKMVHAIDAWLEQSPNNPNALWKLLIPATLLHRWDRVREIWTQLTDEPFAGEGPVEHAGETCVIRFTDEEDSDWGAQRDGPVTARIFRLPRPDQPQHYGERVVFNPAPVGEMGEKGAEIYVYSYIETLEEGQVQTYGIDGAETGNLLQSIEQALDGIVATIGQLNAEAYRVFPPGQDSTVAGFYGVIGLPTETDRRAVHERLLALAKTLPTPLLWAELAEESGDAEEAERQRAIATAWGID